MEHIPEAQHVEAEEHHGKGGEVIESLSEGQIPGMENGRPQPGIDAHLKMTVQLRPGSDLLNIVWGDIFSLN